MERMEFVDPEQIVANPLQPRRLWDDKNLDELAQSLKQDGMIQPLIVQPTKENSLQFQIIAGERRLRAAKRAGMKKVPVIVKTPLSPRDNLRMALVENIQRADLSPIEEAEAYKIMIEEQGMSQEMCAKSVGKDRGTIANFLRVLSLPNEVKKSIDSGRLSMGHAKALCSLSNPDGICSLARMVEAKGLSVRKTENIVRQLLKSEGHRKGKKGDKIDPDLEYLTELIRAQLRTKVKILGSGVRGRIEIAYFSASELERILGILRRPESSGLLT